MTASGTPVGYHMAIPYLIVGDAAKAIEFYKNAFGATEFVRLADPNGKIGHAELRIGSSPVMLADEFPDMGYRGPLSLGGSAVSILLYVDDVDDFFGLAIDAGAKATMAVQDQFDGDRRGALTDPFGHVWLIATRKESISPQEMQKRYDELLKQGGPQ